MSNFNVEKDWITKSGLRAVVIWNSSGGHRCGYVGVPKGHDLYGAEYNEPHELLNDLPEDEPIGKRSPLALLLVSGDKERMKSPEIYFNVHGGITFSRGETDYPVKSDLWWFGYDCGHSGDATTYSKWDGDILRSLDYCIDECEILADQIANAGKRNKV